MLLYVKIVGKYPISSIKLVLVIYHESKYSKKLKMSMNDGQSSNCKQISNSIYHLDCFAVHRYMHIDSQVFFFIVFKYITNKKTKNIVYFTVKVHISIPR